MRPWQLLAAAGGSILLAGLWVAPERAWPMLLLASYALLSLGLAGIFFVALQYVARATWSIALRRVPEAMTALLPVGALGLAIVFLARPSLYPWQGMAGEGAEGLFAFKRAWLSQPFFQARAAFYLLLWLALAAAIVRTSRQQDSTGEPELTHRNERVSAAFLVVFGLTFWLAVSDWIMSLEPAWYSTIFGVYNFAGMFLAGLAAMAILVVWLRSAGGLERTVTPEHLLDLGRLLSAFATFWAYLWFSQYMLIWYANLPEEAFYFSRRQEGVWALLFVLNFLLNWALPFLVLLRRDAKQNPTMLVSAAILVLLGRALDLYLMIVPPFAGAEPVFGLWEAGALAGTVGVFALVAVWSLRQAPLVPIGDPYLPESLHYHA
jgi:hypothetical protein